MSGTVLGAEDTEINNVGKNVFCSRGTYRLTNEEKTDKLQSNVLRTLTQTD